MYSGDCTIVCGAAGSVSAEEERTAIERTGRTVAGAAAVSSRSSRVSSPFILLPPPHTSTLSSLAASCTRQQTVLGSRAALRRSAHLPAVVVDARLDADQDLLRQPRRRLAGHAARVEDSLASARQRVCRNRDRLAVGQRVRRPLPRRRGRRLEVVRRLRSASELDDRAAPCPEQARRAHLANACVLLLDGARLRQLYVHAAAARARAA